MDTPPPRSKGRPRSKESTVGAEKIVQQTKEILMNFGPDTATRAEIAKRLGIDQRLVRYYFPDIETLLDEALDWGVRDLDETMQAASNEKPTQSQILESRLRAVTSFITNNPGYFRTLMERIYNGSSEYSERRLVDMTFRAYDRHDRTVRKGQETGEFKEFDPRFLYIAILGMAEILVTSKPVIDLLFEGEDDMTQRYQDFMVDLVFHGILGKKPAA